MVDEHEDIREKIRLAIEAGKRAMEESEQMIVDAKKVRAAMQAERERKLAKPDDGKAKA
jgi:hypothetical protein